LALPVSALADALPVVVVADGVADRDVGVVPAVGVGGHAGRGGDGRGHLVDLGRVAGAGHVAGLVGDVAAGGAGGGQQVAAVVAERGVAGVGAVVASLA